jgi:2'-5' RNA ligase
MTKTEPADYLDEHSVGYIILALPSENFKKQITVLLNQLQNELPGLIRPMLPEQLHFTLCEIIQPKAYSEDKDTLYNRHRQQYEDVPRQILANLKKFSVKYDIIKASPQAIIVKSSDSSNFNSIRAQLTANMQLPKETTTPPDITHSTIARYLNSVDLGKVQEVISRHKISIKEEITEFKLLRTEINPLQRYEVVRTFPLLAI